MNIREQIDELQGLGYPQYDEIADTLEKLNAVAIAADKVYNTIGADSTVGGSRAELLGDLRRKLNALAAIKAIKENE